MAAGGNRIHSAPPRGLKAKACTAYIVHPKCPRKLQRPKRPKPPKPPKLSNRPTAKTRQPTQSAAPNGPPLGAMFQQPSEQFSAMTAGSMSPAPGSPQSVALLEAYANTSLLWFCPRLCHIGVSPFPVSRHSPPDRHPFFLNVVFPNTIRNKQQKIHKKGAFRRLSSTFLTGVCFLIVHFQ